MTPTIWHKIASEQPADRARVIVRSGHGERPARWDAGAREWYLVSATVDWRASAACYPEWRERN